MPRRRRQEAGTFLVDVAGGPGPATGGPGGGPSAPKRNRRGDTNANRTRQENHERKKNRLAFQVPLAAKPVHTRLFPISSVVVV